MQARSEFRNHFAATGMANLGDGFSTLALPWLATLISRNPMDIALVTFALRLPWFLFALPAGAVSDRVDRRRLILSMDVLRGLLALSILGLITLGPSLPTASDDRMLILLLSGIALLIGTAEVLRDNTAQTVLPRIVGADDLERANGQLWSLEHVTNRLIGPPLAGALIALGLTLPFWAEAACYFAAALLVSRLNPVPAGAPKGKSLLNDIGKGVAWIRAHPVFLKLAIMLGFLNLLNLMTVTILILYSQEILGLSAFGHGVLLTSAALGGIAGGLLCPGLATRLGPRRSLVVALAFIPVTPLVLALGSSAVLAAMFLFIEMFAAVLWNVVTVAMRQRHIPDALLGRVNGIYRFFGWGMMPVGALLGGAIVSLAEPEFGRLTALRLPFFAAFAGGLVIFVYGFARLPARSLERPAARTTA